MIPEGALARPSRPVVGHLSHSLKLNEGEWFSGGSLEIAFVIVNQHTSDLEYVHMIESTQK